MAEKQSIKRLIVRDPHGHIEREDSFSVVGEVHVDIVSGYGEPYAESEYVNGILTITIHNIEGNGITDITTDSQEGDEAVNTVTIKTNANPEGVTLEVRNGSRGNGIASSSEVLSPDDGGINTHTIIDTDGNEHVFHTTNGHKGDKGDQGDSAVYDPSSPDAPDFVMASTTGQSTTKAMTQKAVTDELNERPDSKQSDTEHDLSIADIDGNKIVAFKNGHIKTQKFDSSKVEIETGNSTIPDLEIDDEKGAAIVLFKNGHIKTQKFDSEDFSAIKINAFGSPQFYKSDSTSGLNVATMAVSEIYDLYDALVSEHDEFIKQSNLGMDASNTYEIRHYTLKFPTPYVCKSDLFNTTDNYDEATMGKRNIFVNAGIHGDEKPSAYGVYLAIKELLESDEPWAWYIKANFNIEIVPLANPWGFANNTRTNSASVDLNRQFKEANPPAEVVAVRNLVMSINNLAAIIDMHNTSNQMPYVVAAESYTYYPQYCKLASIYSSMFRESVKTVYGSATPKAFGLYQTSSSGQLHWLANQMGVLGNTFEVPIVTLGSGDSKYCKITKEILINTIQLYGNLSFKN